MQTTEYNQHSSRFRLWFFGFALGFCLVLVVGFLIDWGVFYCFVLGFLLFFFFREKKPQNKQQKPESSFWLFDDTQSFSITT